MGALCSTLTVVLVAALSSTPTQERPACASSCTTAQFLPLIHFLWGQVLQFLVFSEELFSQLFPKAVHFVHLRFIHRVISVPDGFPFSYNVGRCFQQLPSEFVCFGFFLKFFQIFLSTVESCDG